MITMQLEQKLTKQQIFEFYCNQVDLGRRGSFMIRGFGEASQAYFGKDIKSLTVPEAATLAAMLKKRQLLQPLALSGPREGTPQHRARPDARKQIHR